MFPSSVVRGCLIALVIAQAKSQTTDACLTPNNEEGSCISIHECEYLANLIKTVPNSINLDLVQKSRCAFLPDSLYPWVCCPNSRTTSKTSTSTSTTTDATTRLEESEEEHPNLYLLPTEECGLANSVRIIGGNETAIDEYPWTALLEYETDDGFKMFGCGGVLISKRYVLTAAHCTSRYLRKLKLKLVNVRLGEHNTETDKDCVVNLEEPDLTYCAPAPLNFGVEQEISHPNYTTNKHHYNDIALLRLSSEVPNINSEYIKTICIPNDNEVLTKNFVGQNLVATGWGRTGDPSGRSSPVKLKVRLPVVDNAACARDYIRNEYGRIRVTENQICAGGRRDKDACGGDSGGPLMGAVYLRRDLQVHFHVIGVVSYGADCKIVEPTANQTWIPGVYTRVASYREWILDQLKP